MRWEFDPGLTEKTRIPGADLDYESTYDSNTQSMYKEYYSHCLVYCSLPIMKYRIVVWHSSYTGLTYL